MLKPKEPFSTRVIKFTQYWADFIFTCTCLMVIGAVVCFVLSAYVYDDVVGYRISPDGHVLAVLSPNHVVMSDLACRLYCDGVLHYDITQENATTHCPFIDYVDPRLMDPPIFGGGHCTFQHNGSSSTFLVGSYRGEFYAKKLVFLLRTAHSMNSTERGSRSIIDFLAHETVNTALAPNGLAEVLYDRFRFVRYFVSPLTILVASTALTIVVSVLYANYTLTRHSLQLCQHGMFVFFSVMKLTFDYQLAEDLTTYHSHALGAATRYSILASTWCSRAALILVLITYAIMIFYTAYVIARACCCRRKKFYLCCKSVPDRTRRGQFKAEQIRILSRDYKKLVSQAAQYLALTLLPGFPESRFRGHGSYAGAARGKWFISSPGSPRVWFDSARDAAVHALAYGIQLNNLYGYTQLELQGYDAQELWADDADFRLDDLGVDWSDDDMSDGFDHAYYLGEDDHYADYFMSTYETRTSILHRPFLSNGGGRYPKRGVQVQKFETAPSSPQKRDCCGWLYTDPTDVDVSGCYATPDNMSQDGVTKEAYTEPYDPSAADPLVNPTFNELEQALLAAKLEEQFDEPAATNEAKAKKTYFFNGTDFRSAANPEIVAHMLHQIGDHYTFDDCSKIVPGAVPEYRLVEIYSRRRISTSALYCSHSVKLPNLGNVTVEIRYVTAHKNSAGKTRLFGAEADNCMEAELRIIRPDFDDLQVSEILHNFYYYAVATREQLDVQSHLDRLMYGTEPAVRLSVEDFYEIKRLQSWTVPETIETPTEKAPTKAVQFQDMHPAESGPSNEARTKSCRKCSTRHFGVCPDCTTPGCPAPAEHSTMLCPMAHTCPMRNPTTDEICGGHHYPADCPSFITICEFCGKTGHNASRPYSEHNECYAANRHIASGRPMPHPSWYVGYAEKDVTTKESVMAGSPVVEHGSNPGRTNTTVAVGTLRLDGNDIGHAFVAKLHINTKVCVTAKHNFTMGSYHKRKINRWRFHSIAGDEYPLLDVFQHPQKDIAIFTIDVKGKAPKSLELTPMADVRPGPITIITNLDGAYQSANGGCEPHGEALKYNSTTLKGHSGTPVFGSIQNKTTVFAVHTDGHGKDTFNSGVLFTPELLAWMTNTVLITQNAALKKRNKTLESRGAKDKKEITKLRNRPHQSEGGAKQAKLLAVNAKLTADQKSALKPVDVNQGNGDAVSPN